MKKAHKTKIFKSARNFPLAVFAFCITIVFVLLPYRVSLKLGSILGFWVCFLFSSHRKIADENLKEAFKGMPYPERRKIRNEVFTNMGMNLSELCMMNFRRCSFWLKKVDINGKNRLEKALNDGKGVLLLSAHVGNWELLGAYLAMSGFPVNVAARKIKNDFLNTILVCFRTLRGVKLIYRSGTGNLRRMIEVLKKGEILGVLIDQDTRRGGIFIDFFGKPCYTPVSVARFGDRENTLVIPGFICRRKRGHKIYIYPPVTDFYGVRQATEAYSRIIENFIRMYPAQWIWFYRRWKRQPS